MPASESIEKMLRSVLQSSKLGVLVSSLQSEYRALCGEPIPLGELGFSSLEDYLRSIPAVVRLEVCRGELRCFAQVCKETAHIAELVAGQRAPGRSARSQVVKYKMRFKPATSDPPHVHRRSSLRQPSSDVVSGRRTRRPQLPAGCRGVNAAGDHRQLDQRSGAETQVERRAATPRQRGEPGVSQYGNNNKTSAERERRAEREQRENPPGGVSSPDHPPELSVQSDLLLTQKRLTQLLEKYPSGLWASKLPDVYTQMFGQKLDLHVLKDIDKWTHICVVEDVSAARRADRLIYPPLPSGLPPATERGHTGAPPRSPASPGSSGSLQVLGAEAAPGSGPPLPKERLAEPPPSQSAPACPPADTVEAGMRSKIQELLAKYRNGLWAHTLPQIFVDTHKTPLPEHILENLTVLQDICSVEYPIPCDKKKAILINCNRGSREAADPQRTRTCTPPSGVDVVGPVVPPCLHPPSEQYPSVLVTEVKSSDAVTVRYVGENYSEAQEAMEDAMQAFYIQSPARRRLTTAVVGQLVAVQGEDQEEFARGQIIELTTSNEAKVYYLDYGLAVETDVAHLWALHHDFLTLPFQATSVGLAGLQALSSDPTVTSTLDNLAVGKILLMESVEPRRPNETQAVVLYDTSQDEDVNINSSCLKALRDKTMNKPLTITNLHGNRVAEVLFVDFGVRVTVELPEL